MEFVQAKTILQKASHGEEWFGIDYKMSDTYNPFEKEYEITRNALKLISYYNFGVSIETKSNLIARDIDLFKEINSKAEMYVFLQSD